MRALIWVSGAFLFWDILVRLTGVPPYILPPPMAVLRALYDNTPLLAHHGGVTLVEILLGLVIGCALGVGFAVGMALSPRLRRALHPALVVSQTIPVFALAPILSLWLGYGMGAKIMMTVLIVFFPLTSAFLDGLLAPPRAMVDLADIARASPWRRLRYVQWPHAMPALGAGLRISVIYAPIGAVIGEWVGASRGIGYLMLVSNARLKTDVMFAALVVLVAMALALHWAVGWVTRRYF